MEWIAIGLVPLVMCGVMCIGGIVLAALGLRKVTEDRDTGAHGHSPRASVNDADRVTVP